MEFRHFVQLIAIGLQARIPMHMTGFPGVGKTEFTKSLEAGFDRAGIKCKVFILVGSIREPQDFGGFPVSTPDGVRLLPMAWARDAQRLAEDGYLVVVFLDELTTVPPTTQAAMLRLLTENVCGELRLPDYEPGKGGVVYLCASNAVEWAAGGQEIQAPMANRLWHGEFPMDHETWCDMMVSDFPAPSDLPVLPADYLRTTPSSAAGDDCRVCEGRRARCLAGAARRSGAAERSVAVGPHLVSGVTVPRRDRSRVAGQSRAAGRGARRPRRRPGAAVPRVPRDPEPAGSGGHPEGSAPLRAARSRRSRVCRVLRARRRRPQQQDAAAMGSGDDRARRRVPEERRHPDSGGAHAVRQRNRPEGLMKLPEECRPFYELMQMAKLVPRD